MSEPLKKVLRAVIVFALAFGIIELVGFVMNVAIFQRSWTPNIVSDLAFAAGLTALELFAPGFGGRRQ